MPISIPKDVLSDRKASTERDYRTYLSPSEVSALRKPNNLKAISMFAFNWLLIALSFAAISMSPSLFVTGVALLVLAGRQLGIGILLHECSHRSFFSTPALNQHIGHWLGGMPLLVPMDFYRPYHMLHHSQTGTDQDPDVGNIKQYPISNGSMARKILRDFSGLSGIKIILGVLVYVLGNKTGNTVSMGATTASDSRAHHLKSAVKHYTHAILFHSLFFAIFFALQSPVLYLYWWVCFLFVYPFILRMRQIAEHGAMTELSSKDVRDTTRTTLPQWWERLLFAPNFVNYHCEHHYLPTVPSYHLKAMHRLLADRGFYETKSRALVRGGYIEVMHIAMGKTTQSI